MLNWIAQYKKNMKMREFCYDLAKLNNIAIVEIKNSEFSKFKSIAASVSLVNGAVYVKENPSWGLVLHEICHVLSVEEKYRHLMDVDTVKSYKKINSKYPAEGRLRTESATIGLHNILMLQIQEKMWINGEFFSGNVGTDSIHPEWTERGQILYDRCSANTIAPYEFELISCKKEEIPEEVHTAFIEVNDKTVFRGYCNKNKFFNCVTSEEIKLLGYEKFGYLKKVYLQN